MILCSKTYLKMLKSKKFDYYFVHMCVCFFSPQNEPVFFSPDGKIISAAEAGMNNITVDFLINLLNLIIWS